MTIQQTTADMAYFIEHIKDSYSVLRNAKAILFGKSTGASIAVWTKQKYPFLVDGVLASSPNLLVDLYDDG
jgi:alpha-beta hydrolase superfamily lysophospholipase